MTCKICDKELPQSHYWYKRRTCSQSCASKLTTLEISRRPASKRKMAVNHFNKGRHNQNWKGNEAGYHSLHDWAKLRLVKPEACQHCNKSKPLELANVSQKYKRSLKDWIWLCRSCHIKQDGRAERFTQRIRLAFSLPIYCVNCKVQIQEKPHKREASKIPPAFLKARRVLFR